MALYYDTNTFADISEDLNTRLATGKLTLDTAEDYLNSKYNIGIDEWNAAAEEARRAEDAYYESKKRDWSGSLGLATMPIPAHLRDKEETIFQSILQAPGKKVASGVRGTVRGITQLPEMLGKEYAPETTKEVLNIADSINDYVSKNVPIASEILQRTFDPKTNVVEEVGGDLLALIAGGRLGTKALRYAFLPNPGPWGGLITRVAGFGGADVLLTDKNENITSQLLQEFPETMEAFEILAVKPDDPAAIKILKNAIEAVGLELTGEFIYGLIKGYRGLKGRAKGVEDGLATPPKDEGARLTHTQVMEGPEGEFRHKVFIETPLHTIGDPKKAKEGRLLGSKKLGRYFTSRQGMDELSFRAMETREGRKKSAEALLNQRSNSFIKEVENAFGKKYKDLSDEELTVINDALGRSLTDIDPRLAEFIPVPKYIKPIIKKVDGGQKLSKQEQQQYQEYIDSRTDYLENASDSYLKELGMASRYEAMVKLPEALRREIRIMRAAVDDHTSAMSGALVGSKGVKPKLDKNMGLYLSVDYEFFSNPAWVKEIRKAFASATGDGKITEGEAMDAINAARNYFRKNHPKASEKQITDMLEDYIQVGEKMTKADANFFEIMSAGKFTTQAEHALGKIVTARKLDMEDLKPLLKEVSDPAQRFRSTIRKQARFLAEDEFSRNIKAIADSPYGSKLYSVGEKNLGEGLTSKLEDVTNNYLRNTKGYVNPLAEVFVSQAFKDKLKAGLDVQMPENKYVRGFAIANNLAAGMKTVASESTHMINLQGNVVFSIANGNVIPLGMPKTMGAKAKARLGALGAPATKDPTIARFLAYNPAMQRLFKVGKNKFDLDTEEYRKLQNYNLIDQGVFQEYFLRTFRNLDKDMVDPEKIFNRFVKRPIRTASKIYRAEDSIFKIYNFYAELDKYKRAFPDMPIPEVERLAAERVKDTLPQYSRVWRSLKELKGVPGAFVTAFPSFFVETFRVAKGTLKYALTDMAMGIKTKNTALFANGAERLAGFIGAGYLSKELIWENNLSKGVDASTEKAIEINSAAYNKYDTRYFTSPLKINSKNGDYESTYINISRNDPYDSPWKMGQLVIDSIFNGKLRLDNIDDFLNNLSIIAQPLLTFSLLGQPIKRAISGETKRRPEEDWSDVAIRELGKFLGPEVGKHILTTIGAYDSEKAKGVGLGSTDFGFPARPSDKIKRHLGITSETFNLNKSLQYNTAAHLRKISSANSGLMRFLKTKQSGTYDFNSPEFWGDLNAILEKSYQAQKDLALLLYETKKATVFNEDNIPLRITNPMLREILGEKDLKKIDPKVSYALLDNIFENKVGIFKPPFFTDEGWQSRAIKESKMPRKVMEQINGYIIKYWNNKPLLQIEEED